MVVHKVSKDRFHKWSLVLYERAEDIINCLLNCDNVIHYALSPQHTLDLKKDGGVEEPHYHLLLVLDNKMSLSAIANHIFGDLYSNLFGERLNDSQAMFKYLTHDGFESDSKVLYNEDEIVCDDKEYWVTSVKEDDSYQILIALKNGANVQDLVKEYGRKVVYHLKDYLLALKLMDFQDTTLGHIKDFNN